MDGIHIHIHDVGLVAGESDEARPQDRHYRQGLGGGDLPDDMTADPVQRQHAIELGALIGIGHGQLAAPAHQRPLGKIPAVASAGTRRWPR